MLRRLIIYPRIARRADCKPATCDREASKLLIHIGFPNRRGARPSLALHLLYTESRRNERKSRRRKENVDSEEILDR
jgi:hypothetical protein